MINFIKKLMLSAFALGAAFGVLTSTASAGYYTSPTSLNQHPSDCPTVMVANHTTQAGVGSHCWSTSIPTVQSGEVINVMVYYHNTGYSTAHDVRVKLNNPTNTSSSFTFSGSVSDSEGDHASGSVSVNLASSQSLEFGSVKWYPNQSTSASSLPSGQSGNEIFSSSGLSLGNLSPDSTNGYSNQGTVVVSFKVSGNGSCSNCNGEKPTVSTYNYEDRSNELGRVTLKGAYNGNGYSTTNWFEYQRNNGSTNETTHQSGGSGFGNMSKTLNDLSSGTYRYRAVAHNENGTAYGEWVTFTIDRGDNCDTCDCNNDCGNNDGNVDVTTQAAEDIDEESAVLVGDLNDAGSGNTERWFEWDTNKSDVEDGDGSTLSVSGDTDHDGEFSKRLTGLDNNRTYYFRACAEDDNGDQDCGSVKSFRTDDNGGSNGNNDRPDITTLNPVSVGSTIVTVDGFYDANGCSVTTWYEYGRTNSLGSSTNRVNRGDNSGSMVYSFTSLSPDTTYYYRAVGENCEGTTRGVIKSFTTGSGTVVNPPVIITGGGSGNAFLQLTIDNHRDIVRSNTDIAYDVQWGNVTRSTLKNLVLQINFPDQMVVLDTDRGSITRDGHQVIVEIDQLGALEKGDMTITAQTKGNLKDGDPVVAQAVMAFENPKTGVAENAIAYDSDEFSSRTATGLGASLFGLDFLPGSLAGWLLILILILLIIILARHFMAQNQNKVTVNTNPTPVPPTPDASGSDYIVYRPTPKA